MNDFGTNNAEGFVVAPDYDLPELTTIGDVDWLQRCEPMSIATTYFDTAEHHFARRGLTLHQEYDGDCDRWILSSVPLRRRLLIASSNDGLSCVVPALLGAVADRQLIAQLALTTVREISVAMDDEGQALVEICVDHVSARSGAGHDRRSWDSLSVDFLGADQDGFADQVRRRLAERGAFPSDDPGPTERLLGVVVPERPRKLAGLIHDYVMPQLDQLVFNDVALRRGLDAAHESRLAARRILSVVRVMADAFQADEARLLRTELSWFAGVLGSVTDCDARRRKLHQAMTSASVAPGHHAGRKIVRQELVVDRELALSTLRDVLRSDRYAALLDNLAAWRSSLAFAPAAAKTSKRAVRRYLERAGVELEWRLVAIHDDPTEQNLHAARQAARRARFISELAQPALGKPAKVARGHATDIQERLGEHRDAVIAAELSNRLSATLDGDARELLISLSDKLDQEVELARKRSLRVLIAN